MSATFETHQPIRFMPEIHCGIRDGGFKQIVQCGDETQFQFRVDTCSTDVQLLDNESFIDATQAPWSTIGTWVYDNVQGTMTCVDDASSGVLSQSVVIADGVLIKIVVNIESLSDDVVVIAGNDLSTRLVQRLSSSGVHEIFHVADQITEISLSISSSQEAVFNSVKIFTVNTNYHVRLIDGDGSVVDTYTPDDDPDKFDFNKGFFTFTHDWLDDDENCQEGCFRFEVSEPCDCTQGGLVIQDMETGVEHWDTSLGPSFTIVNGFAAFGGGPSLEIISIEGAFCQDVAYRVSYDLTIISGTANVFMRIGTTLGTFHNTTGSYTDIIVNSAADDNFDILVNATSPTVLVVSNLKIERAEREYEYSSNWLDVSSVAPCSSLISVCCDEDDMGFGFNGTGFSPKVRIECDIVPSQYPNSFSDYENSFGIKKNWYFRGRKQRTINFAADEFTFDFLGFLKGYDHIFVDGVEHVVESDNLNPEPTKDYNYYKGQIDISLKSSLIEKRKCTSLVRTCAPDGQGGVILDEGRMNIQDENGFNILDG